MFYSHEIIKNVKLNSKFNLVELKVKSKNFFFKTGQFVAVKINENVSRLYSIASTPKDLPYWKMFIDITPGGPGTTFIKSLKKGQMVETSNPKGQFLLSKKSDNFVFGATGCGIAPLIPMISEIVKNKNKKASLIWGLRFNKDIALIEMLDSMANKYSNFSYEIVLSKPNKTWNGTEGHAVLPILDKVKKFENNKTDIYLSGSREFVKETSELLKKERFPLKKIYFETCY